MVQEIQQVVEQLNINVDLLFEQLKAILPGFSNLDQTIVCQSLLGYSPQEIANLLALPRQKIRDRLSDSIYPSLATLMQVEQEEIAGKWVIILNFLLSPKHCYKLNPAPQLNSDNFQGSFGRQIFLAPPDRAIVRLQIDGTQFYRQGLFYQAAKCFLWAWQQEKQTYGIGNPEVLIYLNNCLIDYKFSSLQEQEIQVYTLAVVVPFHHNQGQIAAEILRGVAQIQSQNNLPVFDAIKLRQELNLDPIRPSTFFTLNGAAKQIALKILVVNDPNNLYTPYNQTAESLANLAAQIDLIAVVGHYSSEMTQEGLSFYAKNGLALVNSSSTSDQLSQLTGGESLSFFRLTTQDSVNAANLANYLSQFLPNQLNKLYKVAIIYNKNSSYSTSYKTAIKHYLEQHRNRFVFLKECDCIGETYYRIQAYLEEIKQQNVDIIIMIPDGGIEPNSLNNAGLISRLNLKKCLIAGPATFYQENVLHWIHEQSQYQVEPDCSHHNSIIASIPWHWQSQRNGCHSSNAMAQSFCQMGAQLWGESNLTWRSATAFDSVLIILRILELNASSDRQALLANLNFHLKEQKKEIKGVTGIIRFDQGGNRIDPPVEIVAAQWKPQKKQWYWQCLT